MIINDPDIVRLSLEHSRACICESILKHARYFVKLKYKAVHDVTVLSFAPIRRITGVIYFFHNTALIWPNLELSSLVPDFMFQ